MYIYLYICYSLSKQTVNYHLIIQSLPGLNRWLGLIHAFSSWMSHSTTWPDVYTPSSPGSEKTGDMSRYVQKKNEKLRSSHFGISRYGSLYLDGGWMWGEFWFCFVAARIPPARGLLIQAWPSSWFQTPLENLSGEIDVTRIIIQSMISIWNHMKLPNVINVVSKLPIWNGLYHAFLFISCKTVDGGYIISL